MNYLKLNVQLPDFLGNKTRGTVTLVSISKVHKMPATLKGYKYLTSIYLLQGCYHINLAPKQDVKCIHYYFRTS